MGGEKVNLWERRNRAKPLWSVLGPGAKGDEDKALEGRWDLSKSNNRTREGQKALVWGTAIDKKIVLTLNDPFVKTNQAGKKGIRGRMRNRSFTALRQGPFWKGRKRS